VAASGVNYDNVEGAQQAPTSQQAPAGKAVAHSCGTTALLGVLELAMAHWFFAKVGL
jgi:hypothetical protein